MKVTADETICVSSGLCTLTAPSVFDQSDEDGTVIVLDESPPAESAGVVREAANICPSQAIRLAS